jgi:type IV secretory pathway VirJ component
MFRLPLRATLIAGVAVLLIGAAAAAKLAGPWRVDVAAPPGGALAVVYSGDGGWVTLDRVLAKAMADSGRTVVGVDSLRYFWTARTPRAAAQDLSRLMAEYGPGPVTLVGYSFGADALPVIVGALPAHDRDRIADLVLIGPEAKGDLEFQPSQWWGAHTRDAYPVAPVVARLADVAITCLYGRADQRHAACQTFPATVRKIALPGDHHFNGDYAGLGRAVIAAIARRSPGPARLDRLTH